MQWSMKQESHDFSRVECQYRYDFIFENRHIAYIISTHCIPVDALKELGDIDPRVASRIYLKSNFVDLGELDLLHSINANFVEE